MQQADLEDFLAQRAIGLGATLLRGHEIVGLHQDADQVTVSVIGPDGRTDLRASYLVGCDGGRSTVRTLAGFPLDGHEPTITGRLGDVAVPELLENPGAGWHRLDGGVIQVTPLRVLTVEFDSPPTDRADRDQPMTKAELAASLARVVGRPVDIPAEPQWVSRFTDNTRLVDTYRRGRVLLAGDAAHIHSPFGGQGLNLGLQDAMNLGWKLAATLQGWAGDEVLDTYTAERRPVAAGVLHNTRAQVALMNPSPQVTPLRELFTEMMDIPEVNQFLGAMITALDVRYDCGEFLPPAKVRTPDGTVAARELLHSGRPVLLDLSPDSTFAHAAARWGDWVHIITGESDEIGSVLVRPDGYVCWEDTSPDDLTITLRTWFGG
ncbi:FAD-dependent monooxygenase [Fodinicola feengrottensis]|uniref:FAD-dependent monooxygenase n=1 Tax=Fodinicola feengrottensis TaxID=435914 RepID=UPI0024415863|nr:FAD-dependent monooxygenase [Fodinicola feengrottensis]